MPVIEWKKILFAATAPALIVAASAFAAPQAAGLSKEFIGPAGGFTQVVTSTSQGVKTIYVSGQVGQGDDFVAHVDSAFAGVVRRLESAGATPADVVKIRIYVKDFDPETYGVIADARRRTFVEGRWPASTMVGVQSLFVEQLQVEIEAIAVIEDPAAGGAVLQREFVGPSSGFSRVVTVTSGGVKTIWVSGQVAQGDDLAAQSASVFEALARNLETVGASLADVVKTNTYIADYKPEDRRVFGEVRTAALGSENLPSSTLIGVQALAADRFKVEVDAVAVVGEEGVEREQVERAFIDPAGGFTQVVTTEGGATKTVYVSGQVGRRADDLETQAEQAYGNLRRRLEAAGASVADLVKVNFYFANYRREDARVLGPARSIHGFPDVDFPAATLIGIPSLYADGALIEIEGIAIVGR